MAKPPGTTNPPSRLCPTCGTRVGAAATKCLVCGADLAAATGPLPKQQRGRGFAPPTKSVSISMPLLIGVVVILLLVGAGLVYAAMNGILPISVAEQDTPTPTASNTLPPTATPPPTATETPVPTSTPLPPIEYEVRTGDTCISIAFNAQISVQSLNTANPTMNCDFLTVGMKLLVPQPTHTPTPLPSATLPPNVVAVPTRPTHTVLSGETLAGIARFWQVNIADIMLVNNITDPSKIREGQVLVIPIELRVTPGPTPTPTLPPPWPAPALLNPQNGAAFKAEETVTLQWATVGELRPNEVYYITVEDVTCGCALVKTYTTLETKLIVPLELRPTETSPHIFRWNVNTARQRNVGENTPPVFEPSGVSSPDRYFSWVGP